MDWMTFIENVRMEAGHNHNDLDSNSIEIDLFDEDCRLLA